MTVGQWTLREGAANMLGATYVESDRAYNFAIYSRHATRVVLEFFTPEDLRTPVYAFEFVPLENKSGSVWHCRIAESLLREARYYAYRIDGPAPKGRFEFHAFDFEKLLLDPYARNIHFPPEFSRAAARIPGANRGHAPLAVMPQKECNFDWQDDVRPQHDSDLVIYEMHVRGFTRHSSSGVSEENRGTFLGVVDKIPYLNALGVTAVGTDARLSI